MWKLINQHYVEKSEGHMHGAIRWPPKIDNLEAACISHKNWHNVHENPMSAIHLSILAYKSSNNFGP